MEDNRDVQVRNAEVALIFTLLAKKEKEEKDLKIKKIKDLINALKYDII